MKDTELRRLVDEPALRSTVSAVELTTACLDRAEASKPEFGAFYSFRREAAITDAHRVDEHRRLGTPLPLDGMPVGVKDNIDVAGLPTTAASAALRDNVPAGDAEVVRRIRAAGGVVIGKTALHEFAFGSTCDSPWFGRTYNPWDMNRLPGASSCGSGVALAHDLCVGALGSDTGGSIRAPASFQSIAGLRPTTGAVSNSGLVPLSWNLDTIGPMARSVQDVAALYSAMVGFDGNDPHSLRSPTRNEQAMRVDAVTVRNVRMSVPRRFFYEQLEPEVSAVVEAAVSVFRELGASVDDADVSDAVEVRPWALTVMRTEAWAVHQELMERSPDLLSPDMRERLPLGGAVTGSEYARSVEQLRHWAGRIDRLFDSTDVLILPTTPCVAPLISDVEAYKDFRMGRCTLPWSAAGTPALSIPGGLTRSGLPVGVQLVTRRWNEQMLFRVGRAFQSATEWHHLRPPLYPA